MPDLDSIPHGLRARLEQKGALDRTVVKFQVEGPWNIGDPVHESITHAALQESGLIEKGTQFNDPAIWEYLRGIFWNDDPEGFFFDHNEAQTDNWSNGIEFLSNFSSYKSDAMDGMVFGPATPLLGRSHFGDLQCLHAMASCDGESAIDTRDALLRWGEFLYSVGVGSVAETEILGSVTVGRIHTWFPASPVTVRALLLVGQQGNLRHRAIGALLHIIQDSFAKGHVERNISGAIVEFHSYLHQDSSKHAQDDVVAAGGIAAMPGAQRAIHQCRAVLDFWKSASSWALVREYLETQVFTLASDVRPASAGQAYRTNLS
ncbi:MAG: hypothetical protein R3B11_09065 [Nitrospira sp.]|nr:hypothetical protein [Nitrospira sp.]